MNACLTCRGDQELVVGVAERGPHDRLHEYTRVLFCAACDTGELRSYSYDGFVVHGEEDEIMTWSGVIGRADVDRLRVVFGACPDPRDHQCGCAVHGRLRWSSERTRTTRLPEHGPDRHSPAGRITLTLGTEDGLPLWA